MEASPDMLEAVRATAPGATVIEVAPLVGGSSATVVKMVLELVTDQRRVIVFRQHTDRVQKGHGNQVATKEFLVLKALAEAGLEVPTPLAVSGDAPVDGSWLSMELIEGSSEVAADDLVDALSAMADFLARLHRIDTATVADAQLSPLEDPVAALPAYLPDDAIGEAVAKILESGVERHANPDVVLHGDYWPGNLLYSEPQVGERHLAAVIDWEDASLGDPLVDLACARVELTCAYGPESARIFTERYLANRSRSNSSVVVDLADLPLWELYVSATALASMHQWGLAPADEAERRLTTRSFFDSAARMIRRDVQERRT